MVRFSCDGDMLAFATEDKAIEIVGTRFFSMSTSRGGTMLKRKCRSQWKVERCYTKSQRSQHQTQWLGLRPVYLWRIWWTMLCHREKVWFAYLALIRRHVQTKSGERRSHTRRKGANLSLHIALHELTMIRPLAFPFKTWVCDITPPLMALL